MSLWEYKTVSVMVSASSHVTAVLNDCGLDGWELVTATFLCPRDDYQARCIFKRQLYPRKVDDWRPDVPVPR